MILFLQLFLICHVLLCDNYYVDWVTYDQGHIEVLTMHNQAGIVITYITGIMLAMCEINKPLLQDHVQNMTLY